MARSPNIHFCPHGTGGHRDHDPSQGERKKGGGRWDGGRELPMEGGRHASCNLSAHGAGGHGDCVHSALPGVSRSHVL